MKNDSRRQVNFALSMQTIIDHEEMDYLHKPILKISVLLVGHFMRHQVFFFLNYWIAVFNDTKHVFLHLRVIISVIRKYSLGVVFL